MAINTIFKEMFTEQKKEKARSAEYRWNCRHYCSTAQAERQRSAADGTADLHRLQTQRDPCAPMGRYWFQEETDPCTAQRDISKQSAAAWPYQKRSRRQVYSIVCWFGGASCSAQDAQRCHYWAGDSHHRDDVQAHVGTDRQNHQSARRNCARLQAPLCQAKDKYLLPAKIKCTLYESLTFIVC